ncbi:amino acid decarboxylase [Christiangramia fulva]|uniref:Amino acid decarboxylase n=1 Tax=Christiangramia fulva TaxID=2126553 RepID=A0A2R3Z6W1_9FLAO|nr:aminotransferase class V-fold PLP-dependent enzyme [Christiangramia fulva]AVR45999.1 amino acid decarboxylase [Christiangramia fulva]
MKDKIIALEKMAVSLTPDAETRNEWNRKILEFSDKFLEDLEKKKAYYGSEQKGLDIYNFDVDEDPVSLEELLQSFTENIEETGINAASGGHLGYIPGGGLYPSALGDYLAAVTNRYAGVFFASPGAVRLENMLLRWMCRLVGFPEDSAVNLTSGGSISNLMAVVTAREAAGLKARNYEKAVIYLSEQAHHSLQKAIRIAGLSEAQLRYIPLDQNLRISPEELKNAIHEDMKNGLIPFFINASLGTTNTGAIDPLREIGEIAQTEKLWFHIDAAYGGFFKLVPGLEEKFRGVEMANSITLDPHKSLFLPFGTGAILIKDKKAVLKVHHYLADYMQDTHSLNEETSPADISPELTKHFRGLRLWLPLKLFGLKPFRAALEEKIYLSKYFYQEIGNMKRFETGPEPELSIAMFRYVPENGNANTFNENLLEEVRKDGRIFLSSTTINGIFWIRVAILVYRTHLKQIQLLLEILKHKTAELEA